MKKIIIFLSMVMMVVATTTLTAATVTTMSKGSSVTVTVIMPSPAGINLGILTTEPPVVARVQQNSSVNSMPRLGDVTMNNTQNMSLEGYTPEIAQSSFFCSPRSIHFEPYRLALETRVEVSQIATSEISMNPSNALVSDNRTTPQRKSGLVNNDHSVLMSTLLVALKIWPGTFNIVTVNMKRSTMRCYNSASYFTLDVCLSGPLYNNMVI